MLNHHDQILYHIAELQRQTGSSDRFGYVKEVQKDKIRVVYGIKPDGTELLSPWLDTSDQRGGNRERHSYEKGQNVRVSSIAGSFRNSSVSHWSPNQSFPAPDHADDVNGHSGQTGKTAFAFNKAGGGQQGGGGQGGQSGGGGGGGGQSGGQEDYGEMMIFDQASQAPQHQDQTGQWDQGGGQQQGQQQQGQQQQKPTAAQKFRLAEKGYITGRVGKKVRFAAHQKGALIMYGEGGENTVFVDETGCYATKPIQIKKCQIPLDNS